VGSTWARGLRSVHRRATERDGTLAYRISGQAYALAAWGWTLVCRGNAVPLAGSQSRFQFPAQAIGLLFETFTLSLQPLTLLFEALVLFLQPLNLPLGLI